MAPREPRKLCRDPSKFGTVEVEWLQPGDGPHAAEEDLVVAFYTHQAALAVRRSLAERGMTQREFAQRLGIKDETLGRKLRGEAWASLRDLLTWARELGIDVLPAPESREELVPPGG